MRERPTSEQVIEHALKSPRMRPLVKNLHPEWMTAKELQVDIDEAWLRRNAPVTDFVAAWLKQHPGKSGFRAAAALKFERSPSTITDILTRFRKITGNPEALKIKASNREKAIDFLYAWRSEHPHSSGMLTKAASEFGLTRERIRQFLQKERGRRNDPDFLKPQPRPSRPTLAERKAVKREKMKSLPLEEVMESLNLGIAKKNSDIFIPLSRTANQVGLHNPRELSNLFGNLEAAGFHLKRFSLENKKCRKKRAHYYYVHFREEGAILAWLRKNYRAPSYVSVECGTDEAPPPSTTDLLNPEKYVAVSPLIFGTLGLKFNYQKISSVIELLRTHGDSSPVIYRYGNNLRVEVSEVENLEKQILDLRPLIFELIRAPRPK